jgi:hypothetical protein
MVVSMQSDLRRIVVVEIHRRRSGHCPVCVHSLGTGETFAIRPAADGFLDVDTGIMVSINGSQIMLPDGRGPIDLSFTGDVNFDGFDHQSHEPFFGRAGGGTSVTIYDRNRDNYFQYDVAVEEEHS